MSGSIGTTGPTSVRDKKLEEPPNLPDTPSRQIPQELIIHPSLDSIHDVPQFMN